MLRVLLKYSTVRDSGPIVQAHTIKYNAQRCRKTSLLCIGQDIRSWRISFLVSVVFRPAGRKTTDLKKKSTIYEQHDRFGARDARCIAARAGGAACDNGAARPGAGRLWLPADRAADHRAARLVWP